MHIQEIVWDSGRMTWVHHDLLPTKTSRKLVQLFGGTGSMDSTCSQVFATQLVNPLLCFVIDAVILSSVSLVFTT